MDFSYDYDDSRGLRKRKPSWKRHGVKLAVGGVMAVLLLTVALQRHFSNKQIRVLKKDLETAVQAQAQLQRNMGEKDAAIRSKDSLLADVRRQLTDQRQNVYKLNRDIDERTRLVDSHAADLQTCQHERDEVRTRETEAYHQIDSIQHLHADLQRRLDAETEHHRQLEHTRLDQITRLEKELMQCRAQQLQVQQLQQQQMAQQQPGVLGGQQQQPGVMAGQQQQPGVMAGQQQQPGVLGGQQQQPGVLGGQQQQPGVLAGQQQQPGVLAGQPQLVQPGTFQAQGLQQQPQQGQFVNPQLQGQAGQFINPQVQGQAGQFINPQAQGQPQFVNPQQVQPQAAAQEALPGQGVAQQAQHAQAQPSSPFPVELQQQQQAQQQQPTEQGAGQVAAAAGNQVQDAGQQQQQQEQQQQAHPHVFRRPSRFSTLSTHLGGHHVDDSGSQGVHADERQAAGGQANS